MHMNALRRLLTVMFIVALANSASATMIVVIYTDDGFWLGADSYRSDGGRHVSNVCKIHETRFGLLAKSGQSQGPTEKENIYSTDREVKDVLASAENTQAFRDTIKSEFKSDIIQELAILCDAPDVKAENIATKKMNAPIPPAFVRSLSRTIVLFDSSSSILEGRVLNVQPQSDEAIDLFTKYYNYSAPATLNWHPVVDLKEDFLPSSVHEFASQFPYSRSDNWVRSNPQADMVEILTQAHEHEPESVGPPYSIVHVISQKFGPPKIAWITKGVCPGWTTRIITPDKILEFRNEARQQNTSLPNKP